MRPTPDQPLADRITQHRDRLLGFMGDAGRCDDIISGAPQGYSQQYHYNSYGRSVTSSAPSPGLQLTSQPAIYTDRDFGGASMMLEPGTYDLSKPGDVANDSISSIRVPDGWTVTLYADTGLSGASKAFTSDTPYVGDDFNDIASSIKVEQT